MRNSPSAPRGYLYLKLFIFFIILLTVGISALRGVNTYNNRSFLGDSYTTYYSNGKEGYLVSIHPPGKRVYLKTISIDPRDIRKYNLIQISQIVGVPVDGVVVDTSLTDATEAFSLSTAFKMFLFPGSYYLSGINGIDAFKYNMMLRGVDSRGTTEEYGGSIPEEELDLIFRSEDIFNDASSVEVVNGAGVPGLGSSVAAALARRGYNVIAISNAQETVDRSYTVVNRQAPENVTMPLVHLTGSVGSRGNLSEAADIIVVLGRNAALGK